VDSSNVNNKLSNEHSDYKWVMRNSDYLYDFIKGAPVGHLLKLTKKTRLTLCKSYLNITPQYMKNTD